MLTRAVGNTLLQMLVIIGIIGVFCGAALPHFDTRRQDVHTAMRQLVGEFRTARSDALTTGVHYALHMPAARTLVVQRMQQAVDGTWQVARETQRLTLPESVNFFMTPDTIEFNTRGSMVTAPRPLYVYLTDQLAANVHSFSVWPSGQVHEEY